MVYEYCYELSIIFDSIRILEYSVYTHNWKVQLKYTVMVFGQFKKSGPNHKGQTK